MTSARILCVDRMHDGRSLFAQAYLELLRIWLADTTESRSWVYQESSSAGLMLESSFSSKHAHSFPHHDSLKPCVQPARTNWALRAFAADVKSFEGAEKNTVLARLGNRQIRGLRVEDFTEKDFILCFEKQNYEFLKVLRAKAAADVHKSDLPVRIHFVDIGYNIHKSEHELKAAKGELRKWAAVNLDWRVPKVSHDLGMWNTKQLIIPEPCYIALLRADQKRLGRIKEMTGCSFHFSTKKSGNTRLVSIIGKKDRLELAATKVSDHKLYRVRKWLTFTGDEYLVNILLDMYFIKSSLTSSG